MGAALAGPKLAKPERAGPKLGPELAEVGESLPGASARWNAGDWMG